MNIPIWARRSVLAAGLMVGAAGAAYADLPDILVNHDGLYNGVQDTSGPAGGTFTYRAKVKHNAGADASGVVLVETLPEGAIFQSVSGATCTGALAKGTLLTAANKTITCTIGEVKSGQPFKVVDFNVILPTSGVEWKAYATAKLPEPDGENDGDLGLNNKNLERGFTTNSATDLGIELSAPGTVNQGKPYAYTIKVTNYGPDNLGADGFARVIFQMPAGAKLDDNTALGENGWICDPGLGPVDPGENITCVYKHTESGTYNLATGKTEAYTLPDLIIPATAEMGGPIGAAVSVEGFINNTTARADGQLSNNTASLVVESEGAPYTDFSISKTASPTLLDTANSTEVEFTLAVKHERGVWPTTITVTDTLPAGLDFVGDTTWSSDNWVCTNAATTITCQWDATQFTGPLPAIKFKANAAASGSDKGTIVNTASVAVGGVNEPNTVNNSSSAVLTYSNLAQLSLSKTGPQRPVKKEQTFQYTLTITNEGPMPIAAGKTLTLTEKPGTGLQLESVDSAAVAAGWGCTSLPLEGNGAATSDCTITLTDALEVGDSLILVLNASVAGTGGKGTYQIFSNTASIGVNPGDRRGEAVSSSSNVTVSDSQADLMLTKEVISPKTTPSTPAKSGGEVTYRITLTSSPP